MELAQYWNVIWKRRWLVLVVVGLVSVISAVMFLLAPKSYQTEVWFITRQEPSPQPSANMFFTFDRYYNWFSSEFLVDDYTQITESDAFAGSVLQTMQDLYFPNKVMEDLNTQAKDQGTAPRGEQDMDRLRTEIGKLKLADVKEAIKADRKQRELHLTLTTSSAELAKAVADASAIVLTDAKLQPIRGKMVDDKPVFTQIDHVGLDNITSSRSKDLLNAVIRGIIGLVAALALAFLLEYLDRTVRDEQDARTVLELPVLGSIPRL